MKLPIRSLWGMCLLACPALAHAQDLDPDSLSVNPSPTCDGGSETHQFCITLPPTTTTDTVDVMLLFDDTGSFSSTAPSLIALFTTLVDDLQTALPGVDLAFGVSRFEDYGGPGSSFSSETATGRPFTLNQAIIRTVNPTFAADIAAALSNTAPGFGGDGPESAIGEGLFQLATGAGFDGDGNGSSLDSGVAGALATQTAPGTSGDVPAFSSYVGSGDGGLGGAGWRLGSFRIVLLATDICSISAFMAPTIPATVDGTGGSEPVSAFACSSITPGSGRFGFVGDSKNAGTNTIAGAVVPLGAATVPATVTALNALGIRVIGLGPGAAPTASTAPSGNESVFLSALARLTGALDDMGNPLVFNISGGASAVAAAIVDAVQTSTSAPINISLTADPLIPGLTVVCTPDVVMNVGPGETACFDCTFTGNASFAGGDFDLNFRDQASNSIIGTVPVSLGCDMDVTCFALDFETEDDFTTPLVNGQSISSPEEFGELLTISGTGPNLGAAIFDSDPEGPCVAGKDPDLLVDSGHLLILQNNKAAPQTTADIFNVPNDDSDGGVLAFDFLGEVTPMSLDLVDVDAAVGEMSLVILTDSSGSTRTYSVPRDFTGDITQDATTGIRTLDLTVTTPQMGFNASATAVDSAGYDARAVVRIEVVLGSSGAVDNLSWCTIEARAPKPKYILGQGLALDADGVLPGGVIPQVKPPAPPSAPRPGGNKQSSAGLR